jgi:hypothetical protein
MRGKFRLIILGLAIVLLAIPAIADTTIIQLSGFVSYSEFSSVPVGSAFSGTIYYDPLAALVQSYQYPEASIYNPPQPSSAWNFVYGSTIVQGGTGSPFNTWMAVVNDWQYFSLPSSTSDMLEWAGGAIVTGPLAAESSGTQVEVDLIGPNTLWAGTGLPNSFPAIQWEVASVSFFTPGPTVNGYVNGTITSVQVVPEPGTIVLVGIGLVFSGTFYHKRS